MTTAEHTEAAIIPDEVARQIVLPEGHGDLAALHEAYTWVRNNAPLAKAVVEGYDPLWLVSKHADLQEVESQPRDLFRRRRPGPPRREQPDPAEPGRRRVHEEPDRRPPAHYGRPAVHGPARAHRNQVHHQRLVPAHPAPEMDRSDPRPRPASIEKLEKLSASGEIDLLDDWALGFPLHVMMTLFGVPPEDEPKMMKLTQEFFGTADPEHQREDVEAVTPEAMAQQFAATFQDFCAYFDMLAEDRRANPRDDLATIVATAKGSDGEYLPKSYSYGYYMAIATAGHDTTSATLAGTLQLLSQHPDVFARVKADPKLIPNLILEALRIVAPVKHFTRRAEQDYTMRGQTIKKGDRLMLLFQSGNRDEDVFDRPYEFDIDRKPNKQIAFGHGPHMCIGQHLSKLELKVMLEELLPRLESIELLGPGQYTQTNFVGGLKHLPAKLTFS